MLDDYFFYNAYQEFFDRGNNLKCPGNDNIFRTIQGGYNDLKSLNNEYKKENEQMRKRMDSLQDINSSIIKSLSNEMKNQSIKIERLCRCLTSITIIKEPENLSEAIRIYISRIFKEKYGKEYPESFYNLIELNNFEIKEIVGNLTERESKIITMRATDLIIENKRTSESFREISRLFGLTQSTIRKIENKAIIKLLVIIQDFLNRKINK